MSGHAFMKIFSTSPYVPFPRLVIPLGLTVWSHFCCFRMVFPSYLMLPHLSWKMHSTEQMF